MIFFWRYNIYNIIHFISFHLPATVLVARVGPQLDFSRPDTSGVSRHQVRTGVLMQSDR